MYKRQLVTYLALEGPDPVYRYRLSAARWRPLERAIVEGAARRRDRPVAGLRDLADYLRVGPVEQYLMLTGRTCFRGLAYEDLHRLQLDLETTALDPAQGRIFMVAVHDSRGFERVLAVSYTHLDVYKRQGLEASILSPGAKARGQAARLGLGEGETWDG